MGILGDMLWSQGAHDKNLLKLSLLDDNVTAMRNLDKPSYCCLDLVFFIFFGQTNHILKK